MSGRTPRAAALAALLLLLATTDERSFGVIPDGREVLSAAAAMAHFGEIGVSRDWINAPPRPGGDAVSRFGLGLSLLETAPMTLSRLLAVAAPGAFSTPLFVLLPIGALAAAAWALARAALRLGASPLAAAGTGLALVFSTFLWGYAGSDYSEAVQAGLLSLLLLAVVELRSGGGGRRWAIAAGLAAGGAVLVKSLLVVAVLPLLAAAVVGRPVETDESSKAKRSARRRGAAGAVPPTALAILASFSGLLAIWALFEVVRFGKLFGGYGGETFLYPPFAGLLRLTLLPNKGLLVYAPVVLLAPAGFLRLFRRDRRLALAIAASAVAILLPVSAWWAWDGQAGWGPRLLVPLLPPLVLLAGLAVAEGGAALRVAGAVLAAVGVGVNLLGALVPFPQLYALSSLVEPQPVPEGRAEGTPYEIWRRSDGTLLASAPHHLSLTPAWSPVRLHARLLAARLRGEPRPGFPDLDPPFRTAWPERPAPALAAAGSPFAWPFWGRAFLAPQPGTADPWRGALLDQAVRALDLKRSERAASLAARLTAPSPVATDPRVAAIGAEAVRLLGRPDEARALLEKSPEPCHPWVVHVRFLLGGGLDCVPEAEREGAGLGIESARAQGLSLPAWGRAVSRRPGA